MTFWHKEHGLEEFEEIAKILIGDSNDRVVYKNYPSPMYHLKYPETILGLQSNLIQWKKEAKDANHWRKADFNLPAQLQEWIECYTIEKLNHWLSYNISWKNGKSAKAQWKKGQDIYHYFKKEAEFE